MTTEQSITIQEEAAMERMAAALEREASSLPTESEIRALFSRSANRYAAAIQDVPYGEGA